MTIRNRTHVWAVLAATLTLAACGGAGDTAGKSNGGKDAAGAEPAASTSPLAAPGEEGAIAVTIEATTQFDTGCMMHNTLTNASGQSFTLFADFGGTRTGDPIEPMSDTENALTMEITGYTESGQQMGPTAIMGRCEDLDLIIGNIRCREGVGVEGEIGPCPAPVSLTISENVRSLRVK